MAWTLCSKDDVKLLHPASDEALQDSWSDWVEGLIRQHMGAPHLGDSVAIVAEKHSGDGTRVLMVRKPPIISVEAVRISTAALVSTDYVVFPNHVELKLQTFPVGALNVEVDYTSGTASVDPVVRMTAASMVVAILNYKGRMGADASLKWGLADRKQGEPDINERLGLTSHLERIMKRNLRRERLRAR